ncbi:hypothetical protein [Halocynthiibacter styelae]|uniref:Uncharacterized protein n=1 Tax=Halocynthiibacter styelae TaxID=2761955 RepID=A0A8J7LL17_9RHOB|nr:hypothetical protein [Paenihalocynthiibacter styelae]MBI1495050.1 hypothetical protein [Paenihalocynthiibacter styelae]
MSLTDLTLPPTLALILFVVAILAGHSFRRVWKAEGARWQLWLFGSVAAICLITVGFLPLDV